jgi:hypothetical protein
MIPVNNCEDCLHYPGHSPAVKAVLSAMIEPIPPVC